MSFNLIFAVAEGGTTQGQQGAASAFGGMIPLILVFGIMIFFMIRSQKKQQQKQQQAHQRMSRGRQQARGSTTQLTWRTRDAGR